MSISSRFVLMFTFLSYRSWIRFGDRCKYVGQFFCNMLCLRMILAKKKVQNLSVLSQATFGQINTYLERWFWSETPTRWLCQWWVRSWSPSGTRWWSACPPLKPVLGTFLWRIYCALSCEPCQSHLPSPLRISFAGRCNWNIPKGAAS